MESQRIGIIGLGKMGYRIAERLIEHGYTPVAFDLNPDVVKSVRLKSGISAVSVEELVNTLSAPRVILLSIPAGPETDESLRKLALHLSKEDIIIDSGNSFYKDSQRRAAYLKKEGIYLLDAGISGGISGARGGACFMIGGDREVFERVKGIFEALSKDGSYRYLGKSGSGHLVKGYHNLVEYGCLQALAEGLVCIHELSRREKMGIDLRGVCEIWNRGSIVESNITRYAESALKRNPGLARISGSVFGQTQREMEGLVGTAKGLGIEVPSCEAALNARIESQKNPTFAGKIINAIRNAFGGHNEWKTR